MMRSATCGELNASNVGSEATLSGWVDTYRDHGELLFIDLRDRWGITQITFNPAENAEIHQVAKKIRPEFVIKVKGKIQMRPEGTINKKLPTGEIELQRRRTRNLK